MSCALTIENLTCKYQTQTVLESLSLTVQHGEIVCLLGASGCGKTTLLKAIAGLLPLASGTMTLNCQTIDNGKDWIPPEKRNIGMIFQDYALFPHLTVEQNVGFGLRTASESEKHAKVQEMLKLVKLDEFGDRFPHQLSGGQQQRVAIARSLAYKPDLLLLDEPFSNIDTQVRHELIREIRKIFKAQGVTAIFVTHSREEAFAFSDKMAVMNNGVIEQFGSASELYYQPSSKFVADFLGGGSYLPAKRVSTDKFDTAFGVLGALAQAEIHVDQECELLLRPQHIKVSAADESSIQILEQQFMGDHCRYVIEANGTRLIASSSEALDINQKVNVQIESDGVLAF
ncbi:iron ABC transporter ATP-binding protein [Vibrio nigripulchritudo ATCC 27043]|uniref:ATPase FbpC (Ferric cations import ATP-binding protein) n=2 Tax=Vibrio nigripulchritudo TaxID=28173 RepID=U4K0U9_9VIBR|nr:ABC transporter ATP-binding protein [Vibrio nigripulchritudo]EGU59789.1 iron ABC transporter ATP-binding protein [Vibrio nigripulchritudo ATCC 27043]KJY80061.1 ABC transporter [Vibrio nigripulchritudo]CCN69055.1 ATPase FbpC (Ferric cations import ATP-binding protein) [Vibrio nigripulchritudo SFn118]CCN84715.1 ATPase FbpC (Ferric cations import ATP-binding protein) [Vibrio nigripulchritudo BLFn1]CCN87793.1 ATPase FbpC (Ferric cations import ATP-binding protein) [Vibrio nigripulchritudo SFn27